MGKTFDEALRAAYEAGHEHGSWEASVEEGNFAGGEPPAYEQWRREWGGRAPVSSRCIWAGLGPHGRISLCEYDDGHEGPHSLDDEPWGRLVTPSPVTLYDDTSGATFTEPVTFTHDDGRVCRRAATSRPEHWMQGTWPEWWTVEIGDSHTKAHGCGREHPTAPGWDDECRDCPLHRHQHANETHPFIRKEQ